MWKLHRVKVPVVRLAVPETVGSGSKGLLHNRVSVRRVVKGKLRSGMSKKTKGARSLGPKGDDCRKLMPVVVKTGYQRKLPDQLVSYRILARGNCGVVKACWSLGTN